ncbi:GNAT family N-acetyltransferase [Romboutsia lituseburensis]|uniref:Diamine N-acetyltransferase n=1 Tax=Romboutsia lituseburensis DSM 797 TaxID=1121325 RepID=A0A1G9S2K3_9FIRM|nr:GNAT family N-acetyltransferase [Romboutsia lituseburensis]CEH32908.1 Spermine/spermidine acetyltransferase [Romboutsia lituseburensis]SDM29706.1 diamine N-acetyltransferase [Romboutsia lituseburensis DSM 797]
MSLAIKNIDESNREEILKLKVSKSQESFIETIKECLDEASEDSKWRTVGVYDKDTAVGFAMYALFLDEGKNGRVWLDRFLISQEHQGKGYGENGIKLLIKQLYDEYGYKKIYLSVYDINKKAIALYKKIGFDFNGEVDLKGEKVMVINLDNTDN